MKVMIVQGELTYTTVLMYIGLEGSRDYIVFHQEVQNAGDSITRQEKGTANLTNIYDYISIYSVI